MMDLYRERREAKRRDLTPERFRMGIMALISVALLVAIYFVARQQIGIVAFKALMISGAAVLGYWVDRTAFPYSRPSDFADADVRWRYEWRRAAIIIGAMVAAGLAA